MSVTKPVMGLMTITKQPRQGKGWAPSHHDICVTAAGLRASNSRNTSVWPELIRLGTRRVVTATRSVTVMEYYFCLWAGTRTSHTERWRALSSQYSLLLGCWPFGFPITLTLKTGVRNWSRFYRDTAIRVRYGTERNKIVGFLRISKVPGVGPGEELHGMASDCDYWWQIDCPEYGPGVVFKGGTRQVTLPDFTTAHVTPARHSVTRSASRSRQPSFAYKRWCQSRALNRVTG